MSTSKIENEIEQTILTILLVDNSKIDECYLEAKHFSVDLHSRVYQAMQALNKEHKDEISIVELFEMDKLIYSNADYVMKLIDSYVGSANFERLIAMQIDNYKKIETIRIVKKLNKNEIDYVSAMEEIKKIDSETTGVLNESNLEVHDIYDLVTTDNFKLKFKKLYKLQKAVGFIEKTLNIIAARTSVGKSAFALNLLNDLSDSYKCLYLNMEMTEKELYQRLVAMNSNIPINEFTKLDTNQSNILSSAIARVVKKKYKIYNGSKSIKSIKSIVQRESKQEHCIVFVDYIGYVHTNTKQNDRERIGEAVRELQLMTKDFNITLFVLAQINREGTEAPTLTHLKDSGELEQTGHAILILHDGENDLTNQYPDLDIIVAKNRSGRLGKLPIKFNKAIQKFEE